LESSFKDITVIGLGLIGGSFALNLKRHGFKGKIKAVDINKKAIEKGIASKVVDEGSTSYEILSDSDLIVIATPVGVYRSVVESIKKNIKKKAIVTDLGSVKGHLVYMCEEILDGIAPFVGGHPIAGTEKSGVENAVEGLFERAKFIITPTENTDREAKEKVSDLWKSLGSEVIEMDPFLHDKVFASVSHLPHVVAYSMVDSIAELSRGIGVDLFQFAGGGFRDFTRIALSDPVMWRDICIENRENILEALKVFKSSIEKAERLIKDANKRELQKFFEEAKQCRKKI
jgi:prephenate dehydrogenase